MKKRTKKKIAKYGRKAGISLVKLIFVYPVKGIVYGTKRCYKLIQKSRETNKEKKVRKSRPKNEAKYDSLQEIKNKTGELPSFEKKVYNNKSTIGIILGARGTGKSAIGIRLLENFAAKTHKKSYALGFKAESLPSWISVVKNVDEIENNSVILIDESGIEFSSREAMSKPNKMLSNLLLISRHKDISIIFITQSCLPLTTKVKTPEGIKSLKELKREDVILSYDFKNNRTIPAIAKKSEKIRRKLVNIHLEDGTVLKCSPEHRWPVFNDDGLAHKTTKNLNIDKDNLIYVPSRKV